MGYKNDVTEEAERHNDVAVSIIYAPATMCGDGGGRCGRGGGGGGGGAGEKPPDFSFIPPSLFRFSLSLSLSFSFLFFSNRTL